MKSNPLLWICGNIHAQLFKKKRYTDFGKKARKVKKSLKKSGEFSSRQDLMNAVALEVGEYANGIREKKVSDIMRYVDINYARKQGYAKVLEAVSAHPRFREYMATYRDKAGLAPEKQLHDYFYRELSRSDPIMIAGETKTYQSKKQLKSARIHELHGKPDGITFGGVRDEPYNPKKLPFN